MIDFIPLCPPAVPDFLSLRVPNGMFISSKDYDDIFRLGFKIIQYLGDGNSGEVHIGSRLDKDNFLRINKAGSGKIFTFSGFECETEFLRKRINGRKTQIVPCVFVS